MKFQILLNSFILLFVLHSSRSYFCLRYLRDYVARRNISKILFIFWFLEFLSIWYKSFEGFLSLYTWNDIVFLSNHQRDAKPFHFQNSTHRIIKKTRQSCLPIFHLIPKTNWTTHPKLYINNFLGTNLPGTLSCKLALEKERNKEGTEEEISAGMKTFNFDWVDSLIPK